MQDIRTKAKLAAQTSKRRHYPAQFKAQIVRQAQASEATVAGTALHYGINPVTVHRWIREAKQFQSTPTHEFVPLHLAPPRTEPRPTAGNCADIQIEIQRAGSTIRVQWPVACAAECASWMREILK